MLFLFILLLPQVFTSTDTPFPYTTLFRSALGRVVPGGRRGAGHVLEHLGVGAGVLHALHVAAGEAADQRDVHAADEADLAGLRRHRRQHRSEEHTSELQSLMRNSYAVICLKKKKTQPT